MIPWRGKLALIVALSFFVGQSISDGSFDPSGWQGLNVLYNGDSGQLGFINPYNPSELSDPYKSSQPTIAYLPPQPSLSYLPPTTTIKPPAIFDPPQPPNSYLPPQPPSYNTPSQPNNLYLPPSPATEPTPTYNPPPLPNSYLPPQPPSYNTPTPLNGLYLPPAPTTKSPPVNNPAQPPNSYLPPKLPSYNNPPPPNEFYLPPPTTIKPSPLYPSPQPPNTYLPPTNQEASRRESSFFPQSPKFTPNFPKDFSRQHSVQLRSPDVNSDRIPLPPFPSRVNAEEIEDYDIAERVRNGRDTEFNPFLERSGVRALSPPLVQYLAEVGKVFKANSRRQE